MALFSGLHHFYSTCRKIGINLLSFFFLALAVSIWNNKLNNYELYLYQFVSNRTFVSLVLLLFYLFFNFKLGYNSKSQSHVNFIP